MRTPRSARGARGSGLILCLIALTAFALLAVLVYRVTRTQVRESLQLKRRAQAQAIAEAGLEAALGRLAADPSWRAGYADVPFGGGSFTAVVSTDAPPWIAVTGYSAPIPGFGAAVRSVRAQAAFTLSTGAAAGAGSGYALAAQTEAAAYGTVDSYSSLVSTNPAVFGAAADVWSNGTVITAAGAVRINGDAYYFSGTAPSAATVSGAVVRSTYTQALAASPCAPYKTVNDNATGFSPQSYYNGSNKDVTVPAGQTATLAPGNYYFRRLTINGTLNVANAAGGLVNLCTSGYVNANAGCRFNNLSQIPSRLMIYGDAAAATHVFRCGTPLHAELLDRTSTYEFYQTVYGSAAGNRVRVNAGAVLHFDTQEPPPAIVGAGVAPGSWTAGFERP